MASPPPQQAPVATTTTTTITTTTSLPTTSTTHSGPAATSLIDTGQSTRPRDARTIHMVLASLGITAYQERVPLQLLDFAYRYAAGVLSDAQHLAAEGYIAPPAATTGTSSKGAAAKAAVADEGGVGLAALRLATANRNGYQFAGALPKETLLEMAAERNKVRLPEVHKELCFGVRLPHERFVMTGTGWDMLGEWDSEGEEEEEASVEAGDGRVKEEEGAGGAGAVVVNGEHGGVKDEAEADEDEDMADDDGFDQVFGREADTEGMEEG